MRLTDEDLADITRSSIGVSDVEIMEMARELRERRAADRELARHANVCRGFYHRNVEWPRDGVRNLLDAIDKLLEANER